MLSPEVSDFIDRLLWWNLGEDNIKETGIRDLKTNEYRKLNQEEIAFMNKPVTTQPLTLYLTASGNKNEKYIYRSGMSILDILGAIYTYYQQPMTINEIKSSDVYNEECRKDALENMTTRMEWMGDHVYFDGLFWDKDGYRISLGS